MVEFGGSKGNMTMARIKRDPKKVTLAQAILEANKPNFVEDIQDALKDIFDPMFEAMLKVEMDNHFGYDSNDKSQKENDNRRNGYGKGTIKIIQDQIEIEFSRDRDDSFKSTVIPKRQKDVSSTENPGNVCKRNTST